MKISVLTVCRNADATIARTISSFLSQVYPNKELRKRRLRPMEFPVAG